MDQLLQQMQEMQEHMAQMTVALRETRDRAAQAEFALAQQSAVPASPPSVSSRRPVGFELVDTKLLTKPRPFGGKEEEWGSWSFKMLAYIGALDGEMLKELMAASLEAVVANVQNSRMTTEGQERSRQMYYILILLLEGQALQVVKALPSGEGYRV
jgi:DNA-binding protein YbaB